jgi:hypothetical protein
VITEERPAVIPVITPVDASTVAAVGLLLTQVPPGTVLVNVVVRSLHTDDAPDIAVGAVVTVATAVVLQPELRLYVIIAFPAVVPAVTAPFVALTVTSDDAVDHVPPVGLPVSVVDKPTQTISVPDIAGAGLTVTTVLVLQSPPVV